MSRMSDQVAARTQNVQEMKVRDLMKMRPCDVEDRLNSLMAYKEELAQSDPGYTENQKAGIVAGLKKRLADVCCSYAEIDAHLHPNVIVAELAKRQGKEEEIKEQLGLLGRFSCSRKTLDEQIDICKDALVELQKSPLERRSM